MLLLNCEHTGIPLAVDNLRLGKVSLIFDSVGVVNSCKLLKHLWSVERAELDRVPFARRRIAQSSQPGMLNTSRSERAA